MGVRPLEEESRHGPGSEKRTAFLFLRGVLGSSLGAMVSVGGSGISVVLRRVRLTATGTSRSAMVPIRKRKCHRDEWRQEVEFYLWKTTTATPQARYLGTADLRDQSVERNQKKEWQVTGQINKSAHQKKTSTCCAKRRNCPRCCPCLHISCCGLGPGLRPGRPHHAEACREPTDFVKTGIWRDPGSAWRLSLGRS